MMPVSGNRFSISGALGTSLVAIALTSLFVLSGLGTLLATAFGPGTGGVKPEQEVGKLVALHNEQIKTYQERFNGRSAFFTPPPPPKPQPKVDNGPPPPPPPPPPPAGPPEKYTGPSIRFVVGDTVYFAAATGTGKPFKINVGETSNGVKVLAVKGGWTVRLGHAGGEYDVPLFPGATEITAMLPSTAKTSPLPAGFVPVVPGGPDLTPRLPAAAAHPTTTTAPDDAAAALAEGDETSEQAASNLRTAPLPNGRSGRTPPNPRPATTAPGTVEPADANNERNQPDNPEDEGSDAEKGDDAAPPVAHPRDPGRVDNPPEPEQEDNPASPAPPSTAPATPAPPATAPGPGAPK